MMTSRLTARPARWCCAIGRLRNLSSGPGAAFPDVTARLAGQDRAGDHIEEMIGAWRERGLVVEPGERRD